MSIETSYPQPQQLDAAEGSPFTHKSQVCGPASIDTLDSEPGTLNETGGSSLFGEPLTDQSGNSLLT
ncbi:MAG: hypothetical protein EBS53_00840 [Bacteroidetes bacterium]|nr:hypothetical protein [Bacteroidota bacterium]